jgi:response regulator of citrate/malate metabolism
MVLNILIVDPDKSAAEVTAAVVQRIAPTASLAIERLLEDASASMQQRQPDVLIIDPSPYHLAGIQLIELLKRAHPVMRMIVVASSPTPALRTKMQYLGVDGYLEKPALLPLFVQELHDILQSAQQHLLGGQDAADRAA